MNDAHELREVKALLTEIREEFVRDAAEETWTRYASVTLVIIAVAAAFSAQLSGRYGENVLSSLNDSTLEQGLATDQWGYFQSKSIKQHMYEISRDSLPSDEVELRAAQQKEIDRYDVEKQEILATAKDHEKRREEFREVAAVWSEKARAMGLAVTILTIAIAVGSLSILVEKKWLYALCVTIAILGTVQMVYGWKFIKVIGPEVL